MAGIAFIHSGNQFTLPELTDDGVYDVTYFSVDALGNTEAPQTLVNLDRTPPSLAGLPAAARHIWPPNERMVQVATWSVPMPCQASPRFR